ncbi:hypothetical protein OHA21_16835 [Actinoplanes sp. NBC_00393]|uniref:hypothetical protein n=1 Tax=Actinoplanes sp. NBC_00393 TaxID=2975953 RepID=UPI002E1CA912
MEFQYWQLAVVVALVVLVVWGLRAARRTTLAVLAATLLIISGFLLYTLVLNEPYLEQDANSRLDAVALIGIPALLGAGAATLALRHAGSRRD